MEILNIKQKIKKSLSDMLKGTNINPNIITVSSLVISLISLAEYLTLKKYYVIGIALSFLLDAVDGAIARAQNKETQIGAFLDGVTDRVVEYVSLTILFLEGFPFESFSIFVFGSCLTSFIKAYALSKGLEINITTLFPREIRTIFIVLSLITLNHYVVLTTLLLSFLSSAILFIGVIKK